MGREKSDDRMVPEGLRKLAPTHPPGGGGKAVTVSESVTQLELFSRTADSPKGGTAQVGRGRPRPTAYVLPKLETTQRLEPPATEIMKEVTNHGNLVRAFEKVASNKGAPGADGQSIEEVRKQLPRLLPALRRGLLEGSYQPGLIRRVWIPKRRGRKARAWHTKRG